MHLSDAERLLLELGITEPYEIDLEAIALYVGARVRYRPLEGSEARITGFGDQAIITVKADSHSRRKRFSIAHELGHWHYHRGQCLVCRGEETRPSDAQNSPERIADRFAADLLMPAYLFGSLACQHVELTFKMVTALAEAFKTSHTATAIRLVESDHSPALLVCHGPDGRKWFIRSPSVPRRWFPKDRLDANSFTFGVLFGNDADMPKPHAIGAATWFDRWDAARFEIYEQAFRTRPNETLTFILIKDSRMLDGDTDRQGG